MRGTLPRLSAAAASCRGCSDASASGAEGGFWLKRRFKNGNVAVLPSSSSASVSGASESASASPPSMPMLPSISATSPVRLSRSASEMPSFSIISSTGLMCSSRAQRRHSPSLWDSPFSIRVIKITATFFLQREQSVGCIDWFSCSIDSVRAGHTLAPSVSTSMACSAFARAVCASVSQPMTGPANCNAQHSRMPKHTPLTAPMAAPPKSLSRSRFGMRKVRFGKFPIRCCLSRVCVTF